MTKILMIIGAVVILGGGAFIFTQNTAPAAMENKEGDAMMQKDETAMMEKQDGEMMAEKTPDAMMQKTDGEMMKDDSAMMENKDEGVMMNKGSYEAYAPEKIAKANEGNVVLFFRAAWCPTCRALDVDIKKNLNSIPAGVNILDVNYDTAKELKQRYGVTYQHTFVQVDANGAQIAKWSKSPTLAALLSEVK